MRTREDLRVVHLSVQGNHLHFIVEAADAGALARGMRALGGRIAKGLDAMMDRRGPVFADRYHAHVLRTPAEVRNALRYVLGNFASHAARRGEPMEDRAADRFSSAAALGPDGRPFALSAPRTWPLRTETGGTSADSSHAA